MPHSAHAQSRRIEVLQHVACREQKANSGKRNPEGAGFAVQRPPEWSPGAGRPVEQDTDGPGAGRLFVEDSRDISHASLSVHAEPGPETSQSPARSILARRRLPRSLHQRIRTHAHGGLIVGLFVEQQDLSARFHITCGSRTQARFLLSCRRNGTKSQLCGGRHRTKIRCWSRLARQ